MRKTRILAFALAVIMVFSMVSVFASAAFTPTSNADIKAMVEGKGGKILGIEDFEAGIALKAPTLQDGSNGENNTYFQLYDGENNTLGTKVWNKSQKSVEAVKSSHNTAIKTNLNITRAYTDGENGAAIRFYLYHATGAQMLIDEVAVTKGEDFWVTYDEVNKKYAVVSEETEGAIKAKAVAVDDNNNCIGTYRGDNNSALMTDNIFNSTYVVSLKFRFPGEVNVVKLISPVLSGKSDAGGSGLESVALDAATDSLKVGSKVVAKLDTTRYYDVSAVYYTKKDAGAEETYTWTQDVYLDGILVFSGPVHSAFTSKAKDVFDKTVELEDGNKVKQTYYANALRYFFVAKYDRMYDKDNVTDVLFVKNYQDYYIDTEDFTYTNYVNSGNTVEGYDLTLGSTLGLNYKLNLLPDVVADANAKVVFKIGEEVVAEKNVSEVTPDAKGIYTFTCPVNSTQMASDIKMSIESTTREYKIYMNGVASDEFTYSVKAYADYILASEDAVYESAKPVVKAMLNYGAYAQEYFEDKNGTDLGALANVGCEFDQAKLDTAVFGEGTATVTGGLTGIKATLVLDTDTVIKIYKDSALIGESAGITADKLDEDVTITVEGGTVKVSVLTLAKKVNDSNVSFKNLAKALALYSQATETYKAAQ